MSLIKFAASFAGTVVAAYVGKKVYDHFSNAAARNEPKPQPKNEISDLVTAPVVPDEKMNNFLKGHKILVDNKATIAFDPAWENGTGYLDGACQAIIPVDGYYATEDSHGRKIVIHKNPRGIVVVFQRHIAGQSNVIVSNNNHPVPFDSSMTNEQVVSFFNGKYLESDLVTA